MQTPVLTWGGRHNLHNGEYREAFTRDAPPERHNPGRILWGEDMSGIKEAYTTQELMIILGVRDASTVLRRAKREGWLSRSCSGRGGGFEWLVSSMPEKTRLAIAYAVKPAEDAPATVAAPALPSTAPLRHLSEKERNTVMARLAFVREIERLALVSSYKAAISSLALASLQGTLPARLSGLVQFANARYGRGESRGLSERRLYEWRAAYAEKGEAGLIPCNPQKVMTPPAWLHLFLAFWQRPQKPSVAQAYEEFAGACQSIIAGVNTGFPVDLNVTDAQRFLLNVAAGLQQSGIPSVYAVRRWLQKIALPEREAGRRTGNALLHLRPHKLRLTDDLLPTDVYTADGTTADVEVLHPYNGQPFKPELTFVVDVATRRVVGVSVALTADAFFADVTRLAAAGGARFVIVDMEQKKGETVAEDRASGRRLVPYFTSISPDDVWDWGMDAKGLAWAVVHSEEMEHPAAFAAPLRYETLTVWTRDSWTRYRRPMKDKENTEYAIAEDGERKHGLGAVPLVPFLFEPTSPMTGLPATDDVLSLILRIYRRDSELDKMLFDRAVPLLNVGGVSQEHWTRSWSPAPTPS